MISFLSVFEDNVNCCIFSLRAVVLQVICILKTIELCQKVNENINTQTRLVVILMK